MSSWFYFEQTFSTSQGWFSFFIRTIHRPLEAKFENHSKTISYRPYVKAILISSRKNISGNSKLTLDEIIVTGSACSGTTLRTTRAKTTRTTRAKTTRTTKPRITRPPRTTKPRTRTTKPPRTKKPRRIPNRFKRVCVYGRTIKVDFKLYFKNI